MVNCERRSSERRKLLEAQANGLPCISSTEVPHEAAVTDKVRFLSLKDELGVWENYIVGAKRAIEIQFPESYYIQSAACELLRLYVTLTSRDERRETQ